MKFLAAEVAHGRDETEDWVLIIQRRLVRSSVL